MDAALDQETWKALTGREPALPPEAVQVVARQVRAGTYRPHATDVAELLIAWLFVEHAARQVGSR